MVAQDCNPRAWEAEMGGLWDPSAGSSLYSGSARPGRDLTSESKVDVSLRMMLKITLWPPHTPTHTNMYCTDMMNLR